MSGSSTTARPAAYARTGDASHSVTTESSSSAVAWSAIFGGAFASAAMGLLLLWLGAGIGLASVSPFTGNGASAGSFTAMTAIWMVVVAWVSAGFGGYLTGRLRTKWVGLHTDEVFFRDTAHGFLSWAVASVAGAMLFVSALSSIASGGAQAIGSVASGAGQAVSQAVAFSPANAYSIDSLFRSDRPDANASSADMRAETSRILVNGLRNGSVPDADKAYLSQMIAARTGLSQADASKRVDDTIAQMKTAEDKAKQAADATRKAGSYFSIYSFASSLIGAFIACVAAALGGRHRDEY